MSNKPININNLQDSHIERGKQGVKKLLDENPNVVAVAAVVVRRNGSVGYSITHIEGPAKLALMGGLDVVNKHMTKRFIDEY